MSGCCRGKAKKKAKGRVNQGRMMKESVEVKEAIVRALNLEEQGCLFYTDSASRTKDKKGNDMFWYLAGEEKKHFDVVRGIWVEQFGSAKGAPQFNPDVSVLNHKIFGLTKNQIGDELDALNKGIEVEESSISLYQNLAKRNDLLKRARLIFDRLAGEEEKHLAILYGEIEFVTKTGEYTDFKTVTT